MAGKKNAESVDEPIFGMNEPVADGQDEDIKIAPAKTEAKASDPWQEKKTVFLQKDIEGENFQICSVNGRVYKVKRGEAVEVPLPIYEVLQHSMEQQSERDSYIEEQLKALQKKEVALFG